MYVAHGTRLDQRRRRATATTTSSSWPATRRLPEPRSSSSRPATSRASTTSRAIDKELLRQHREGLIVPLRLPQGWSSHERIARGNHDARRRPRRRIHRHLRRGNFFLEIQDHGIPEQRKIVPSRASSATERHPLVAPTTPTTCTRTTPSRTTCCSASAPARRFADEKRMKFDLGQLLREVGRRDAPHLPRTYREASRTPLAIAEMCNLVIPRPAAYHLPKFPVPAGKTLPELLRPRWPARGWSERLERAAPPPRAGARPQPDEDYRDAARLRDRRSSPRRASPATSWWSGTSSTGRRSNGIPVGPGPRLGRRARSSPTRWDHRPRSARYDLLFERFLNPERISHARLRHRLLHAPPRRGHRLRPPEIRRATASPRSSPSARSAPRWSSATSAACWACPTPRPTGSPR